jgi:hypothetical protein
MKTKSILLSLVAVASGISIFAQENDDMYFTSKDRAKINQRGREEVVMASAKSTGITQTINPSDSYSGRNENPDYIAGNKVGSNAATSSPYFTPSYQPNVNQSLYSNNCNCGYNNYASNYPYGYANPYGYGGAYSGFYPYRYGGMMGMGGYGYGMSPYYGMGYGMGSYGMGYGVGYYGMGYGLSSMFGYGMGGYGYSPFGYGYSPLGYGYGYPTVVVVNSTSDRSSVPYGRHSVATTSSGRSNYYNPGTTGRGGNAAYYNGSRSLSGARVGSSSQQSQYYSNAWRQSAANNRSSWSNSGSSPRSSFWGNSNNSGWNNSSTRQSWSNPSSNWGGGGMRSTGFSGGGFGGGGGGHIGGGGHGRR